MLQQMFQVFQKYIAFFRIGVAKVDHDVAKLDRNVAYVAMAMHVCFEVYVPNVSISDICCKCFHLDVAKVDLDVAYTCMLQVYVCFRCFICLLRVFYLDVVYILQWFSSIFRGFRKCFRQLFQLFHLSSFYMLQLLHPNISKVDQVLHME
jgi:hypothetical protein